MALDSNAFSAESFIARPPGAAAGLVWRVGGPSGDVTVEPGGVLRLGSNATRDLLNGMLCLPARISTELTIELHVPIVPSEAASPFDLPPPAPKLTTLRVFYPPEDLDGAKPLESLYSRLRAGTAWAWLALQGELSAVSLEYMYWRRSGGGPEGTDPVFSLQLSRALPPPPEETPAAAPQSVATAVPLPPPPPQQSQPVVEPTGVARQASRRTGGDMKGAAEAPREKEKEAPKARAVPAAAATKAAPSTKPVTAEAPPPLRSAAPRENKGKEERRPRSRSPRRRDRSPSLRRRRSRSRSRSPRRYSRSRSRSPRRYSRSPRRRSYSRSPRRRSYSRSPRRRSYSHSPSRRSYSRSPYRRRYSRSRSRSRSPSPSRYPRSHSPVMDLRPKPPPRTQPPARDTIERQESNAAARKWWAGTSCEDPTVLERLAPPPPGTHLNYAHKISKDGADQIDRMYVTYALLMHGKLLGLKRGEAVSRDPVRAVMVVSGDGGGADRLVPMWYEGSHLLGWRRLSRVLKHPPRGELLNFKYIGSLPLADPEFPNPNVLFFRVSRHGIMAPGKQVDFGEEGDAGEEGQQSGQRRGKSQKSSPVLRRLKGRLGPLTKD